MESKNTFKIWFFIIILLTFIVGGYFLMKKYTSEDFISNNTVKNETTDNTSFNDIRLDASKDYIYFTDDDIISDGVDISYPKVVINFNDNGISNELNQKMEEIKKELKYSGDVEDGDVSYAHFPVYTLYAFENYLSLVCEYYTYSSSSETMTFNAEKSYIFDKYTGELYTSGRLLSIFNLNVDKVKSKVKKFVSDADLVNGKEETLDVDSTLASISLDSLFIDKLGRLSIGIIVKSNENDYNDVVVLS